MTSIRATSGGLLWKLDFIWSFSDSSKIYDFEIPPITDYEMIKIYHPTDEVTPKLHFIPAPSSKHIKFISQIISEFASQHTSQQQQNKSEGNFSAFNLMNYYFISWRNALVGIIMTSHNNLVWNST